MNFDELLDPDAYTSVYQYVASVQARLRRLRVTQGRLDDVYSLISDPWVLTRAWSVLTVRDDGRRGQVRGVDGVAATDVIATQGAANFLIEIQDELRSERYSFDRLRWDRQGNRTLGIATLRDRVVMYALRIVLLPIYQAIAPPGVYGNGRGRGQGRAFKDLAATLSAADRYEGADFVNAHPSIRHREILRTIGLLTGGRKLPRFTEDLLAAGTSASGDTPSPGRGVAQGTPSASLLFDLGMYRADMLVAEHLSQSFRQADLRAQSSKAGKPDASSISMEGPPVCLLSYFRYADDLRFAMVGGEAEASAFMDWYADVAASLGLSLHPEKGGSWLPIDGVPFLGGIARLSADGAHILTADPKHVVKRVEYWLGDGRKSSMASDALRDHVTAKMVNAKRYYEEDLEVDASAVDALVEQHLAEEGLQPR